MALSPSRRIASAKLLGYFVVVEGSGNLGAGDALVEECANHDATVLRLSFGGLVAADLAALAHGSRGQHVGQGNVTLLQQDIGDVVGTLFAELLVQSGTARLQRRSPSPGCCSRCSVMAFCANASKWGIVLGIDLHLPVGEEDGNFVEDVVVVKLAEARAVGGDLGLVGGDLLLLLVDGSLLFFQSRVLRSQRVGLLLQLSLIGFACCWVSCTPAWIAWACSRSSPLNRIEVATSWFCSL